MTISTFYNHGHTVGRELYLLIRVEICDGLHQTDTPHLEQIIRALPPLVKSLNDGQNQPQIALNELFPGLFVPGLGQTQQRVHLRMGQGLQSGGIHTADLYFSLHSRPPFSVKEVSPFPG